MKSLPRSLVLLLVISVLGPVESALAQGTDGEVFRINTTTEGEQVRPRVAANSTGAVVVWMSVDGDDGRSVRGQRFDGAGAPVGAEFVVAGPPEFSAEFPDVAMDAAGNYVVAFQGFDNVFFRLYAADGSPLGEPLRGTSETELEEIGIAVDTDADGNFVMTWTRFADEFNDPRPYARRFASDGTPRGEEFLLGPEDPGLGASDVAVDDDGDFIVSWSVFDLATEFFFQRFDSDGIPSGEVVTVQAPTDEGVGLPQVATQPGGRFIVGWTYGVGVDEEFAAGARVQRYLPDGTPDGGVLTVSEAEVGNGASFFALDEAGAVAAIWRRDASTDGELNDLVVQLVGSDGSLDGDAFAVTAEPAELFFDYGYDIALSGNQGITVWGGPGENDEPDIFGRRLIGVPVTTEPAAPLVSFRPVLAPNPFAGQTTLRFELQAESEVTVAVYDVLGREVLTLPTRTLGFGSHQLSVEANGLAAGVYVWRFTATSPAETSVVSGRMLLVR